MATTFEASLKVTSRTLSLAELTAGLGRGPQSGSHEKGSPRGLSGSGLTWEYSVWRQNAPDADAPLETQCLTLLQEIVPKYKELLVAAPGDISVWLALVAYYEGAYFSLILPRNFVAELAKAGIDIEITCYPCGPAESRP
jgi:hypothetical protein